MKRQDIFRTFLAAMLAAMFCAVTWAGQEEPRLPSRRAQTSSRAEDRQPVLSELERENLLRVAAPAAQIQEVLQSNAGLLVELKRWVAKEAADNGQIAEEGDLADHAIFDRLARDVQFRSVATRLLQRYGYLTPTPNPDSNLAKEQELVLKERARQMVQIEAQEDTDALARRRAGAEEERTASCDPQMVEDCPTQPAQRARQPRNMQREASPAPGIPSDQPEQLPAPRGTQTIQTAGIPQQTDQTDGLSARNVSLAMQPGAQKRPPENTMDGLSGLSAPSALPGGSFSLPSNIMESAAGISPSAPKSEPLRSLRPSTERNPFYGEEPAAPAMVRRANPYADIPSLYDMYVQAALRQRPPERFGMNMFQNGTRQPDAIPMDLPVGPDYVVGPGDGLAIDLWGGVSQRLVRVVDREGRVSLPETGPLLVSGRTLGEVQQSVQRALRTQFRDVSADVGLSRLRTVRVYVVGDVAEPGAYDISSLSTPLNALFTAGGVTARGSLRDLKHFRGKELIEEVDAYDLLLHGVRSSLAHLENGDTLMVPPIGSQVTVDGMVRRPAVYELRGEKTLAAILDLAGGILPTAELGHIEVQRIEAHQKRTMFSLSVSPAQNDESIAKQLAAFEIRDGDEVHIFPIAAHNEDAIYLQGHVLRPGRYSYKKDMRVTDLIASYNDLLPEPAGRYAEIIRLNAPDNRPSVESFDLAAALAQPASAPKLQPLDTVRIFSRYDFEAPPAVWVGGEVRSPGSYRTSGVAHVRDAVFLAGGVAPGATGTVKIFSVNLKQALAGDPIENVVLFPRDRLLVYRSPGQVDPATVSIRGEVAKPGRYPLAENMRLSDLIRSAGGMKRSAAPDAADLTRYSPAASEKALNAGEHVDVNVAAALAHDAQMDLSLRDGDVLTIPQVAGWSDLGATVTVRGEVKNPGAYGIRPGERLSSVLDRSGGFTAAAYPFGAVLMRNEVRELQMNAHMDLLRRVKVEQVNLRALPESDAEQKNSKLAALAQTETTLQQLQANAPAGRVVIHVAPKLQAWRNTAADVELRDGDVLLIPKKANYVMITGQVFNPTAVSYRPGRSAKWYLSQAGGLTQIADKKAVFVIRADGSVISAQNNSAWWAGDPLRTALMPGDSIVVPEKAPRIGNRNWATLMQTAQVASSVALSIAYIYP
ncbi:MAG: SLBB domain-containing protein [Acidobacteriia bacterium]|nr:SLBB domain-containing protein [Terriglobia bacterium]